MNKCVMEKGKDTGTGQPCYTPAAAIVSNSVFAQTLPPNLRLSCIITLALSNCRMSELEISSFSGLGLLERPSWSVLPPETTVMSGLFYDWRTYVTWSLA